MQCTPMDGAACGIGLDRYVKQSVVSRPFEIVLTRDYCCYGTVDESNGPVLANERIPDLQFIDVACESAVPRSGCVDHDDACDPLAGCDASADLTEECQTEVSSHDGGKSVGCVDVETPGPLKYRCKSTGCVQSFDHAQALSCHTKYECGRRCPKCHEWYAATINADTLKHLCRNVCPQCSKAFASQDALQTHVEDVCGKYLQCLKCCRRFKQLFNLQIHVKHECGQEHRCPDCNKAFRRPYALATHMNRVTGTNAALQCLRCRTCFTSVRASRLGAPGLEFCCPACGRRYKRRGLLTRHMVYECGVEPQFLCPHCPHKSKHKANLRKHIVRLHSYNSSTANLT